MAEQARFQYLNLEFDWQGLTLQNLEVDGEGQLSLARVPLLVEKMGDDGAPLEAMPTAPAGIAVTPACECDVYISDPAQNQILRLDSCTGEIAPLGCFGGDAGEGLNGLDTPRGLAIAEADGRELLYVADSGNHRILIVDLAAAQVVAVLGQNDPYAEPIVGILPEPTALAADAQGNVYVADAQTARITKVTARRQVDETFGDLMAAQPNNPIAPLNLAIAGERLYVLDAHNGAPRVCVFELNGAAGTPASWAIDLLTNPVVIAAMDDAVYVGDAGGALIKYDVLGNAVSVLTRSGKFLGALAIGCDGELLASAGGAPLERMRLETGYMQAGYFRAGPFQTTASKLAWHRWQVMAQPLDSEAHLQLFTFSSETADPPPDAGGDNPFAGDWFAEPRDEMDVLVLSQPVRDALRAGPPADPTKDQDEGELQTAYFWIGGLLRGNGTSSPLIRQMRIDYAPPTYVRYLPALYRDGARRRLFLDLALAALESELGRAEGALRTLPALFDPAAAPDEWLPWLAQWLDFDLLETWSEEQTRDYIVQGVALYAQRGTAEGLKRYLEMYAGVHAQIQEPNANVALMVLDENVALGFNTVLAPAYPQGAVLDRTAALDHSHLLDESEIGAPLFDDVAHRFSVQVYASELTDPQRLATMKQLLDREKPAHTDYHLCVIEPKMRVGFQARIGMDTIVGGPPPDLRLGEESELGADTALANQSARTKVLGSGFRVGG